MEKTNNNNTKKKTKRKTNLPKNTNVVTKLKNYYGLTYFDTYHMTQPIAEALAEDMFDWVCKEREDALTLEEFAQARGIPLRLMRDWRDRFPCIARAYKDVKTYVGNNREVGMLKKKLSERGVLRSMPMYSEKWKELEQWYSTLSDQEQERITLVLRDLVTKKDNDDTK